MYTDWHSLGETNVFYRKWHLYDISWKNDGIEIGDYQLCGAPFGGPVAIIKDSRNSFNLNPSNVIKKAAFSIYSSSGVKLVDILWEDKKLSGFGFNDQEQLVTVLDDGNVLIYDIHGKLLRNFLLFDPMSNTHVIECQFWGNGIVAIAADMQLYVAEGIASPDLTVSPRVYSMKTGLTPDRPYSAMAIIPPLLSRTGLLEVMLANQQNSIIVVDENEVEDQLLHDRISAPVTKMSVAPNGRFLACYRRDGILTVMSSTFTSKVLDFDTKSVSRPMEIAWCGEDAVLLMWKNTGIVMVGPYGDWLNFPYEEDLHLVAEPDCCRIFTSSSCEMLQRVPASTEAIRRIGSTDPAALLNDAMEAFDEGDPKSDENIRSIAASNQLGDAVSSCINAAAAEFDITRQQALMKAASYGKVFCSDVDPSEFVETCLKLRVLNAVRRPEIGIPLTITQYNRLTPEVLVNRLTMRNHHFLALKICELLKLKNDRVLVHWACEKVKKMSTVQSSDEVIRDIMKKKLEPYGRISYLEVANAAYQMGRRRLATMILDVEQNAADQVPLLLSMQEEELALQKAINSEDIDLIYLTLIHLERSKSDVEAFYRLVYSHSEAANLLKIYYRNRITMTDKSILHNLLLFGKNYLEAGITSVNQAYLQTNVANRLMLLREASALFNSNRDLNFHKTITDEQIELLETQQTLTIRTEKDFSNLSLSQTIYKLMELSVDMIEISSKLEQEIQKISKKFKVSEKMYYNLRVQCFANKGQWALLHRLANEKKSPIGYKPFAQACIRQGQPASEVDKYIEKIAIPEDKFELYSEISLWRKAFDVAFKMKDANRMQEVQRSCKDPALERQILDALGRL